MGQFLNSKKFILLCILFLIFLSVFGCAKPKVNTEQSKPHTTIDTIGKLDAIATVLGRMFDPKPCQEKAKEYND